MDAPSDPSLEPGGDLAEGGVRVSENERSGGDSRDGGHRNRRSNGRWRGCGGEIPRGNA